MYCKYDKNTKKCLEVGTGTNTEFYKSIGMTDVEVEKAYDGSYYLKGFAPSKSEDEILQDETQSSITETEARISEIKDELLTAVLLDDTDAQNALKAEYKELMSE